jgi:hypothetical protein
MLTLKLHNGASVSDWLGTAATAARVAAAFCEDVRAGRTSTVRLDLARAEEELIQALDEVRQVRSAVEGSSC